MTTDFRFNPGNTSAENSGSAGISGELGGGWFIEDGGAPLFVNEPAANETLGSKRLGRRSFGERAWSARWWASLVLHEFMATNWHQTTDPIMAKEWKNTENTTYSDITELTQVANQRASVIGEILSQDVEFNTDFMALLGITPALSS